MRPHDYLVLLDPAPPQDPPTGWRASIAASYYANDELEPLTE
jgi:hypothetical protein